MPKIDEAEQRRFDEAIETEVLVDMEKHASRLKDCLMALRASNIPFDYLTCCVLQELSGRMQANIQMMLDDD